MDEYQEELSSPTPQSLESLPQRFDVWQLDARQLPTTIQADGRLLQPWMILVVSATDDQILNFDLLHEPPNPAQAWESIRKAMHQPATGAAHRPTQIQARSAQWIAFLQPQLDALNIDGSTAQTLDQLDEFLAQLGSSLRTEDEPGLLDMPGITVDAVASLFDAAALFFEQAPWQKSGERPIRIECSQFESGAWYAVLMGQAGMAQGLVLYDSLEAVERIQQIVLSEEENARQTAALAVTFAAEDELPARDVQAARQHGWRLAGPDTYPMVYRIEPGLAMRPPLGWELVLLEGCLRSLPAFVRKKTRRLAPFSIVVPIAAGELPLLLSWA